MEPTIILSLLAGTASAVQYLMQVAAKNEENKNECQRLGAHAQDVLETVRKSVESKELSRRAVERLLRLESCIKKLAEELDALSKAPKLKRMLWASNGRESISAIYRTLDDLIKVCTLEGQIDIERMCAEREKARLNDEQVAKAMFERVLSNDQQILSLLDTRLPEMADAIQAIQKRLCHMDDSVQRTVLEKGMRAMQRTTGPIQTPSDDFTISSLEVIIHENRKLGEGGFGQVFHATWLGTAVAVKVAERGLPAKMFEKEVVIWKKLRHPHVLQFYGVCLSGPQVFAICALKAKGNVVEFLESHPNACKHKLLHEAALGLVYLHNHNVVHGDLKASNILVDGNGTACLSDFGLSKLKLRTSSMRTDKKVSAGTLRWMSPEQMSEGVLNYMCDAYSFGMTMYEVFSGQPPFGHSPDGLIFTLVVERERRPSCPLVGPGCEDELDDETWSLVQDLWHQEPKKRPRATQLASRLENLISQLPESSPLTSMSTPLETVTSPFSSGPSVTRTTASVETAPTSTSSTSSLPSVSTAPTSIASSSSILSSSTAPTFASPSEAHQLPAQATSSASSLAPVAIPASEADALPKPSFPTGFSHSKSVPLSPQTDTTESILPEMMARVRMNDEAAAKGTDGAWPGGFVQGDNSDPPPPPYSTRSMNGTATSPVVVSGPRILPSNSVPLPGQSYTPARDVKRPLPQENDREPYYRAYSLVDSYEQTCRIADLTEAIMLLQPTVVNRSSDHDTNLYSTHCIAWAYYKRYIALSNVEDMWSAVSLYNQALEMCPQQHDLRGCLLHDYGYTLGGLYDAEGDKKVIKEAVTHLKASLKLAPAGNPARVQRLDTLCMALLRLVDDHPTYLQETIGWQRESLSLLRETDDPQWDQLKLQSGRRVLDLHQKWEEQRGPTATLAGLKDCHKDAFALLPHTHTDSWAVLLDFGRLVGRKYGVDNVPLPAQPGVNELFTQGSRLSWKLVPNVGPRDLLADVVWYARGFLEQVPSSHVQRWKAVSLLSIAIDWQWQLTKDRASLNEALTLRRQAIALSPRDAPDRPVSVQATRNLMRQAASVFNQPWLVQEANQLS